MSGGNGRGTEPVRAPSRQAQGGQGPRGESRRLESGRKVLELALRRLEALQVEAESLGALLRGLEVNAGEVERKEIEQLELFELAVLIAGKAYGVAPQVVRGPSRIEAVKLARHATYWLCAQSGAGPRQIAVEFSRDHSGVIYGVKRTEQRRAARPEYAKFTDGLLLLLQARA